VGFEPTKGVNPYALSRSAIHSSAQITRRFSAGHRPGSILRERPRASATETPNETPERYGTALPCVEHQLPLPGWKHHAGFPSKPSMSGALVAITEAWILHGEGTTIISGGSGTLWVMAPARQVFSSHTSELQHFPVGGSFVVAAESAVIRAGDTPVDMAYFSADPQPRASVSGRSAQCGCVVGIVGFRYSSPVRDRPEPSYTELKSEEAGKAALPRLVFLPR
jgi:hypothetical protein